VNIGPLQQATIILHEFGDPKFTRRRSPSFGGNLCESHDPRGRMLLKAGDVILANPPSANDRDVKLARRGTRSRSFISHKKLKIMNRLTWAPDGP
jgi:hypothetical protein